jgi:NADH:ubiquinone oxidoreductase subunit 6 (subunit J)
VNSDYDVIVETCAVLLLIAMLAVIVLRRK